MFERYTERARRVIFYARYEASQFGSLTIESEHLLLGLIREDHLMVESVLDGAISVPDLRREIEGRLTVKEKVSTSIDLPLANDCKRVLAYSAEEAERLNHASIGTVHVFLGLLREETCLAAKILGGHNVYLLATRAKAMKLGRDEGSAAPLGRTIEAVVPILRVTDVLRSFAWYRTTLEFSGKHYPDPSAMVIERENVQIMLRRADPDPIAPTSVYFRVHSLGQLRTAVQSKLGTRIEIRQSEYGIAEFTLIDPDGHTLIFAE